MIKKQYDIVVVGGGIAGLSAIKTIRRLNADCSILLTTNEDRLPYKRTKINKHIAAGFTKNQFSLLDEEWYIKNRVDLAYSNAEQLNAKEKLISFDSGGQVSYKKLLLATGAVPFNPEIEGVNPNDLFHVHFAKNVEYLISFASEKQAFLIVGGGVEGIETADQLIKLGKQVTIVERNENPIKRLFPDHIADLFYKSVKDAGVDLIAQAEVKTLVKGEDKKYRWDYNNRTYKYDGIIICAGTRPNIALAEKAGLNVGRGIKVNEFMQTSVPDIFAAGDVAEHKGGLITGLWHPAEYQGINAGENMLKLGKLYKPVPLRLKTEAFGNFYFSANYSLIKGNKIKPVRQVKGKHLTEIYTENDKIIALIMMNDKANSKIYHMAVAEQLSVEELNQKLNE